MTSRPIETVYVLPTGDIPVPLANGRKLLRAEAPPGGFHVALDLWVRRRIAAGELEIVTAAALPMSALVTSNQPDRAAPAKAAPGITPAPAVKE